MTSDQKFGMRTGKKGLLQFQYKRKSPKWTYTMKSVSKKCDNSVQFLLSSQGWIIGDYLT